VNHDGFVGSISNLISKLETPLGMLSLSAIQGSPHFLVMKADATTAIHGKPVTELDYAQGNSALHVYWRLNDGVLPALTHFPEFTAAIFEASAKGPAKDSLSSAPSPSKHQQFAWITSD
jgi:hypothetical protein